MLTGMKLLAIFLIAIGVVYATIIAFVASLFGGKGHVAGLISIIVVFGGLFGVAGLLGAAFGL